MRSLFAWKHTPCRERVSKRQRLALLSLTLSLDSMFLASNRFLHLEDGFWGGFAVGLFIVLNAVGILNAAMLIRQRF
ncbi:hypothetical protein [Alicyclobacillus vulcanalis]|uniref:Uncharacterized protein n=1 Tax=Alicyclobacillus vulcanalis TaxID=252246 RepID=A0A1N7M182_9BACL|nr:hypothetical protein [Alicyclobacillus vulcanalis]SIS79691.1 hypothetical protein SAMN05421799_104135 [Alicyclobacillus vulcanalis]